MRRDERCQRETELRRDPVLVRFREMLDAAYGARIEQVLLYGSRARGEARGDSDYDIAVFLHDTPHLSLELDRLAVLGTDILCESGALVHAFPFAAGYLARRTPLMHEVQQDGIPL